MKLRVRQGLLWVELGRNTCSRADRAAGCSGKIYHFFGGGAWGFGRGCPAGGEMCVGERDWERGKGRRGSAEWMAVIWRGRRRRAATGTEEAGERGWSQHCHAGRKSRSPLAGCQRWREGDGKRERNRVREEEEGTNETERRC